MNKIVTAMFLSDPEVGNAHTTYVVQRKLYTSLRIVHRKKRKKRRVVSSDRLRLEDGLECTYSEDLISAN